MEVIDMGLILGYALCPFNKNSWILEVIFSFPTFTPEQVSKVVPAILALFWVKRSQSHVCMPPVPGKLSSGTTSPPQKR
jgi:hypothetical protein